MTPNEAGYLAVMKVAFEISTEGKNWSDSPAFMAGVPMLAAGGLGIGTGIGTEYLSRKYDLVDPEAITRAERFSELAKSMVPQNEFLGDYANMGSALVRQPAMRTLEGKTRSGREVIEAARGGTLGKLLAKAELAEEFTPDSTRHYREFEKGPIEAAREMFRESFGDLRGEVMGDVLGRRYHAGRRLMTEGHDPTVAATANRMAQLMGANASPDMLRYYTDLENAMQRANPTQYQEFFQMLREGRDPSGLQNALLEPMFEQDKDPLSSHVARVVSEFGVDPETFADMDVEKRRNVMHAIFTPAANVEDSPLLNYALAKMGPIYRENSVGYDKIIKPLSKFENYRKGMRNVGRAAGLAGLLGVGAGGYLLHKGLQDVDEPNSLRVSW